MVPWLNDDNPSLPFPSSSQIFSLSSLSETVATYKPELNDKQKPPKEYINALNADRLLPRYNCYPHLKGKKLMAQSGGISRVAWANVKYRIDPYLFISCCIFIKEGFLLLVEEGKSKKGKSGQDPVMTRRESLLPADGLSSLLVFLGTT
ncbi:hypothetical protein CEXT_560541 [Caerostris extrusa]|uniref:Uncharacterized protein n=1 Tax=Caerostris extrusa TaxID=172846 RepID=A0AAV4MF75_CAEEX|nr:hypothetical protein CEXT_560541 [Caerostris extrusa]